MSERDNVDDIQTYYQANQEEARAGRQQLEAALTKLLLGHYIKRQSTILELGAGAGHYTVQLARAGHKVVATDFSPHLIEENKKVIAELGLTANVTHICADARDIKEHIQNKFDVVVVMGPFYHCLLYTSPSPRDRSVSRMPSSA